jgi:hypothetical protein
VDDHAACLGATVCAFGIGFKKNPHLIRHLAHLRISLFAQLAAQGVEALIETCKLFSISRSGKYPVLSLNVGALIIIQPSLSFSSPIVWQIYGLYGRMIISPGE